MRQKLKNKTEYNMKKMSKKGALATKIMAGILALLMVAGVVFSVVTYLV